jgi:tetratricopeptide (TPR) repeat protein
VAELDDDSAPEDLGQDLSSPTTPNLADALAMELLDTDLGEGGASRARRRRPGVDHARHAARTFLDKQSRMLDIQMEHLHEQRTLILSHLRLRRLNEGFKVALQTLAFVAGAVVLAMIGTMAFQAWRSDVLVIEPIRAPADLIARGMDGVSLSARLLDKLRALQNATDSARAASSYTYGWGDEIKVEIPETGVSIGELQTFLRRWLGRETHISGEVFRGWTSGLDPSPPPPDAISLNVRAGDRPGAVLQGSVAGLDGLIQLAAENLYAQTQPYRWSVYLARNRRESEASAVLARLAASGPREERAWANAYWGGVIVQVSGDVAAGEAKERAALALDPDLAIALDNLAGDEVALGHDAAAMTALKTENGVLVSGRDRQIAKPVRPVIQAWAKARLDAAAGDYEDARRQAEALQLMPDWEGVSVAARLEQAGALARLHDIAGARAALSGVSLKGPDQTADAQMGWGSNLLPEAAIDEALDDWPAAVRDLAAAQDAVKIQADKLNPTAARAVVLPALAVAMARTGDLAGAQAIADSTPLDCYACVLARAEVAAAGRVWPQAERWFAEAVRQAPGLPAAHFAWGRMLMVRGDTAGAISRLEQARKLAPRFADPTEALGEALMKQGDLQSAVRRYADAARLAPRWGRVQLRWGEALLRLNRRSEALAHLRVARGMDLSAADRAELAKLAT